MDQPIIDLQSDHYFMGEALRQAARAYGAEEVPVGAVVVREGKVIYVGSSNFAGWHLAQANEAAKSRFFLGLVSEQKIGRASCRERVCELV